MRVEQFGLGCEPHRLPRKRLRLIEFPSMGKDFRTHASPWDLRPDIVGRRCFLARSAESFGLRVLPLSAKYVREKARDRRKGAGFAGSLEELDGETEVAFG